MASQLQVDTITNAAGTSAPNFSKGLSTAAASGADANTTLVLTDNRMQIVTPSASRTYTLPTTGVTKGMIFEFANQAAVTSANLFLLVNSSGGNLVRTVYPQTAARVIALQDAPTTAAHWDCLDAAVSNIAPFTPAGMFNNSTKTGTWRRNGNILELFVHSVQTGTPTTSAGITLPMSLVIDTANMPAATGNLQVLPAQAMSIEDAGTASFIGQACYSSTTEIGLRSTNVSGTFLTGGSALSTTSPMTWAINDEIYAYCQVPIVGWTATKG